MAYTATQYYAPWILQPFLKAVRIFEDLGIVRVDMNNEIIKEGDYIKVPKVNDISDFARRDITTTGATRTFTEMGTTIETGVILHDDIADKFPLSQVERTGANFRAAWGARVGLKWFRRVKQQLYRVAKTAVEAADTTDGTTASADIHIHDQYSATANQTMTLTRLQDAKAKMGDRAGDLTVVAMHSTPFNNLVKDGISNYKVDSMAGRLAGIGGLDESAVKKLVNFGIISFEALGMIIIADDDLTAISMTGSTYTYKSKYETLLMGADAMYLGYQREMVVHEQDDIDDARGAVRKMRAEVDYCPHLNGIKWSAASTPNPTDAQLGTKSNWDEAYTDHKQVKCVKLITNG